MIQHTVVFRLKHTLGSELEKIFLKQAKALGKLPNVIELKVQRQVSKKNNFTFGLTMYFMSQRAYDEYNAHPEHVAFVQNIWVPEVDEFLEIDFIEESV